MFLVTDKYNIPVEVLIRIFTLINEPRQYLQCACVCRQWYIIITKMFLYKSLNFYTANTVCKSMDFFNKKRKFAELVEEVNVNNCELDLYSILSMPTQIPNLRILRWTETFRSLEDRCITDISMEDLPPKQVYSKQLRIWKNLQKVAVNVERLPLVLMMLQSTTYTNLTCLDIGFDRLSVDNCFDVRTMLKVQPYVKSIINNIKNTPVLKRLRLSDSVLGLEDMEVLHAGAPNLESLHLENVAVTTLLIHSFIVTANGIYYPDDIPVTITPANNLKQLNITFFNTTDVLSLHNLDGIMKDVLLEWLFYIGFKYDNVTDMSLKGHTYCNRVPMFEEPLIKIINKLAGAKSYDAFYNNLTKGTVDAFNENKNTSLEKLIIRSSKHTEEIEMQIYELRESRHLKTIQHLTIDAPNLDIFSTPSWTITTYGLTKLNALSLLHLSCNMHYQAIVLLLGTLPNLKTLMLDPLAINMGEVTPILPAVKSNLRNLYITIKCGKGSKMHQVNQIMEFLIQSCSKLAIFSLKGKLRFTKGILRLCFFNHPSLQSIIIHLSGITYYTFPWVDGKQGLEWANYYEQTKSRDHDGLMLHADISWTSKPKLSLAKAPYFLNQ